MGQPLIERGPVPGLFVCVMSFVVLNVVSPFAAVRADSAGIEALVNQLDAALVRAGKESIVMACEGSEIDGILLATPRPGGLVDESILKRARQEYRFILQKFLEKTEKNN